MITDADIMTARMTGIAKGLAKARKAGKCSHERRQGEGTTLTNNVSSSPFTCLDCGKKATWDELDEERREVLIEWT